GPETDIPAPDVNTDSRVMAWLVDTLSMISGKSLAASVTGKPLSISGSRVHTGATSAGCLTCARAAFRELEIPMAGSRAAVQGSGKVGAPLAFLLTSAGPRVRGPGSGDPDGRPPGGGPGLRQGGCATGVPADIGRHAGGGGERHRRRR